VKPVLITGATGFVGWHVARKLLERGGRIKALVRADPANEAGPAKLRELDGVEPVRGDLRDPESLARAVAGCGVVFHVAADYRLWTRDPQQMYLSNVEGTRNLLVAARCAGVERVVYTSTVGCIGMPKDGLGDEQSPVGIGEMTGPYKRSKFLAEQVALKCAAEGFPVIIVNPTAPVGDHDFKPTPTGKMIVDFVRGAMPGFVDTGLNVVDVRDVGEGHLLALERGRPGERYILGSENLTLQQIFAVLAGIVGKPAPKLRVPYALAYAVGLASTAWAGITGKEPLAPLDGVRMARKKMWVRHEKAARELGYSPGPAAGALGRAVDWFQQNGYVAGDRG
jgi:dihydroflavonol-4-reductase